MTPKILPLKDQVVLVTGQYNVLFLPSSIHGGSAGSSNSLGRAIALAFARQGVLGLVINNDESSDELDDFMAQIDPYVTRVVVVKADVTKAAEVEKLFTTAKRNFGYPITTVVNSSLARIRPNSDDSSKLDITTWEAFDAEIRGSLQAAFNTTKAALPGMRECGFGRIINIGSTLVQNPHSQPHDYAAAKGALMAFTHTIAAEVGPFNINVNLVSCGLLRKSETGVAAHLSVLESAGQATPSRKPTMPEEMADAVLFFASPWARAVTGQSLCVNGGLVVT